MHLDQPLSDKEFDELDRFLLSDRTPEDAMTMDMLHGYLTAIVIGPETILPSEWLPLVWGGATEPFRFRDEREAKRIMQLLMRFMNEIAITFVDAPDEFTPLFCEFEEQGESLIDAEGWAVGFWQGMDLRAEAWAPIWESDVAELMEPIYLLGSDDLTEEEAAAIEDPVARDRLAVEIEANLPLIQRFWLPRRSSGVTPARAEPKPGRNEPCPCGSGKKAKKCCQGTNGND